MTQLKDAIFRTVSGMCALTTNFLQNKKKFHESTNVPYKPQVVH